MCNLNFRLATPLVLLFLRGLDCSLQVSLYFSFLVADLNSKVKSVQLYTIYIICFGYTKELIEMALLCTNNIRLDWEIRTKYF